MTEKNPRIFMSGKTATTLMAYAQLEIDNNPTCIPRYICFFVFSSSFLLRLFTDYVNLVLFVLF